METVYPGKPLQLIKTKRGFHAHYPGTQAELENTQNIIALLAFVCTVILAKLLFIINCENRS